MVRISYDFYTWVAFVSVKNRTLVVLVCLLNLLSTAAIAEPPDRDGLLMELYQVSDTSTFPDVRARSPYSVTLRRKLRFDDFSSLPFSGGVFLRWSGNVRADRKGEYTFTVTAAGRTRIRIEGDEVLVGESSKNGEPVSGTVQLDRGRHKIVVEHVQTDRPGRINVTWHPPDGPNEPVPAGALAPRTNPEEWKKPWYQMEYGPLMSAVTKMPRPKENWVPKARIVRLEGTHLNDRNVPGGITFDQDLLRFAGGWRGEFLRLKGQQFGHQAGPQPMPRETPDFITPKRPGWSRDGSFEDPREIPHGPLPDAHGEYKGLYLHGCKVVFSYRVGDCDILDVPSLSTSKNQYLQAYTRTLRIGSSGETLTHLLAQGRGEGQVDRDSASVPVARVSDGKQVLAAALVGNMKHFSWGVRNQCILLKVAPSEADRLVKLLLWRGDPAHYDRFVSFAESAPAPENPEKWTTGDPGRWPEEVTRKGKMGSGEDAYTVDTIPVPYENPYDAWMRTAAFDFLPGGNGAAISTWHGDVWTVSGIDGELGEVTWRRAAAGLSQPLGLKTVDSQVYVTDWNGLTRLHDRNGDGEFDFYENFNDDLQATSNHNEHVLNLRTDREGNFYFGKGGPIPTGGEGFEKMVPHHGTILRVSPDGEEFEVYASGLREPNGLSVGPDGQVTVSDQEGSFVPSSCIHVFEEKGDYGTVPPTANLESEPDYYNDPLVWIPHHNPPVDNSSGGQVWVKSDRWGPFRGDLLHLSYGRSSLFKVMKDPDQFQGAVVRFPLEFVSGITRGRFHPGNGQLYVAGLQGWQTNAVKPGGFERVRYTGKEVYMPGGVDVHSNGISIRFTTAIDPAKAENPDHYLMEMWNYKEWNMQYGADHYRVTRPDEKGHDKIEVTGAKLLDDGRTVKLTVPELQECMSYELKFQLEAKDGTPIEANKIYGTVNKMK